MKENTNQKIEKEAVFGIVPITTSKRQYGFLDAFLVLSGYCIATWSYTQGSYLTTLVGFKQLLIGAFLGAILMLAIYQLPVILSVRYGIDIWIWLKSVFGHNGIKIMTVVIILINFPWYAVCADLFASSMSNLLALTNIHLPEYCHTLLGLFCVIFGTFIAYKGVGAITWTTRILVPLLILVGAVVIYIGFSNVPAEVIWEYVPKDTGYENNIIPYVISIEANFAFVITLVGGMAEIPRLAKTERGGFWAGVLGQGLTGSFFVVIGAVMAIAMEYVTGQFVDDPTLMLATLATPALALCSLLLVGFANVGTQAVGSYIYAVMIKSSFHKAGYKLLLAILAIYVGGLCIWGKIIDYFGSFLTIGACIYAPLAALLFVDFFLVRKQRISLRDAYGLKGHDAYRYTKGFNIVGLICVVAGVFMSLGVYNPLSGEIHCEPLFYLTPTGCGFLGTGLLYWVLNQIPAIKAYTLRDRYDTTPFDTKRTPPKQNLFFMPAIWAVCWLLTRSGKLKIHKENMKGLKPPYLVLGTHHAFMDFYVTPLALFPHRANYVSELEGFEAYGEWLYRQAGCLGTRKFINDINLVKNIRKVMKRKGILVLYPEARYANVGTSSQLPVSTGKLVKLLGVPLVTINMKGNYLQSPIWNLKQRKGVKLDTTLTQVLTAEEVKTKSVEEINALIGKHLAYDEYKYQLDNNMKITYKGRAKGLEMPLYQCRSCGAEFTMTGQGTKLSCCKCNATWEMDELGRLVEAGEYFHIPDWYEWERSQVIKQIEAGTYNLDCGVKIEALPNAKNFIPCGEGRLVHRKEGFYLTFKDYGDEEEKTMFFSSKSLFSIHTEYDYRSKFGQCVTLSTDTNTYFIYPLEDGFNATKIQFATEYLHKHS